MKKVEDNSTFFCICPVINKDDSMKEKAYWVSEINRYIKHIFDEDFALGRIYIKGEVSNCKYHSSGHIYFTLKDKQSQIACVMFASNRSGLDFTLEEGQSVVAFGNISVYERDGKYQLYAKQIQLDGAGLLYEKFLKLKTELEEEGLFSEVYKQPIPRFAKKVGVVTAVTGAAIHDIQNIATRRNPYIQLYLYPAQVQGQGAAETIVRGIEVLDQMGLDVLIVGRGGGSIEDLWAFNEEIVARAIFACETPVISAVGHETDVTIADFVADLRAPTPSAAAELAVADIQDVFAQLKEYELAMTDQMRRKITLYRSILEQKRLRVEHGNPVRQIQEKRHRLMNLEEKLQDRFVNRLERKKHQLAIYVERLEGLSPLKKLNQGYAFLTDAQKKPVKSVKKRNIGEQLTVSVVDGDLKVTVDEIESKVRK